MRAQLPGGARRRFGRYIVCHIFIDALNFDRAVLQDCGDRSDGREDWRDHNADDAGRERKLRHGPSIVLDDDPSDVAFVNDGLEFLGNRVCVTLE